jgi:hypothetical protein
VKTDLNPAFELTNYRSAHIVTDGLSTVVGFNIIPVPGSIVVIDGQKYRQKAIGDTAKHIQNALSNYGVTSTIGTEQQAPPDTSMIVNYDDEWQWDFKMFLKRLTIKVIDRYSQQIIAEGSYAVGGGGQFHDYPTTESEVPRIINGIYKKK